MAGTTQDTMQNTVQELGGTITIGGDITVPRIGYGALQLTGPSHWGDVTDRENAIALLHRVREHGIRLVDTSDAYGPETNEQLIADALHPYGPYGSHGEMIIATKGGIVRGYPEEWRAQGDPQHLRQACEASLKRLSVERIDLYQLHRPDDNVSVEESVGALVELQQEGKIRHIGISNVTVDQLRRSQAIARIVSVQNIYNVGNRMNDPVLQVCEDEDIAFFPWAPMASGLLTASGGPLDAVARRHNANPAQICIAWLLQRSPVIVPIPGTSSIAHLEENIAAAGIALTTEDLAELPS